MIRGLFEWRSRTLLLLAAALIGAIAIVDWQITLNATLAFLYIFPLVLLGLVLNWWQLIATALLCTFFSYQLDPFPMEMEVARNVLIFLTLATTGLLSRAGSKSYRREMASVVVMQREMMARRAAEEQLEFLVVNSPAAVLTMSADGEILMANPAAHRMFAAGAGQLPTRNIARYIPALASVPSFAETAKLFRTEMQTRGQRDSGEVFLASVFFSTYKTAAGPRLAALIADASEHLREHEEASLQQLLAGSRILVAAVSHEVRNVCGAIGVVHENLARGALLNGNQDFEALGSLVETLSKIASLDLKQSTSNAIPLWIDARDVLTDLRIVMEPSCEENDIELHWNIPRHLPLVQAERHSLLQVLLNLAKNSQRALESVEGKSIEVAARVEGEVVFIEFADNGPGIPQGTELFQPLQRGADATGLGLYLSRAFMRSFRGDLRHDSKRPGCCFVLELAAEKSNLENAAHSPFIA